MTKKRMKSRTEKKVVKRQTVFWQRMLMLQRMLLLQKMLLL